jgi:plastocyanin
MIRMLVFGIVTIALLGCGSDDPTGTDDPADDNTVLVTNNQFSPTPLSVPVNETVTFQWNSGGTVHNVQFQDGPKSPDQSAGTFPRTFDAAGSYPYVCTFHAAQGMTGVVNVTASTGGGGGADGGGAGDGGGGGGGGGGYP